MISTRALVRARRLFRSWIGYAVLVACMFMAAGGEARNAPEWVRANGKSTRYPPSGYITGYGVSAAGGSMSQSEKVEFARNMAMGQLTAGMRVNIESETLVNRFASMVGSREQMVDEFKCKVSARSNLQLDGVRFEEYAPGRDEPAYVLAVLEKEQARARYRNSLRELMKRLAVLRGEGDRQIAEKNTAGARAVFGECERIIDGIEQAVLVLGLLEAGDIISTDDLKVLQAVKDRSRELWSMEAGSMEEAADMLALKLAAHAPPKGVVQVNAPMLEDWYQYSQFSARFRTLLENAVAAKTQLKPVVVNKGEGYAPSSAAKQRAGLAGGAGLLLTGNYFLKPDAANPKEIHCYVRVSDVATGETVASADARMAISAAGTLETKPRNYLQMLEDQRVFQKDELVGGGLNLEAWTSRGAEDLLLEEGDEMKLFVRANKPCFVRVLYHLNNGARILPDEQFMNFPIRAGQVNRVVELPASFEICPPFGAEIIQVFAYTEEQPDLVIVKQEIEGESYQVVSDGRGIRQKIQAPEKTEKRINVTTMAKKTETKQQ